MKLSDYAQATGTTATELAERLGVSVSTITRLIRDERRPSLDLAERIARHTNGQVQPSDFMRDATP